MPASDRYQKIAWADRFQQPSIDLLRDAIGSKPRHNFDVLRKRLLEIDRITETLAWYGDCWKWSIEYRTRLNKPPGDPLVVLIPCPQDVQMALPLDRDFAQSISIKRMKRAVRDGLELAQEPFDTRWSVWSLGNGGGAGLLDDLQDLIELKLKHLAQRVG
jgi:hypothetical protein